MLQEGKLPHEVPTADGLTVRVVNSVIKKCEVRVVGSAMDG